MLHVFEIIKAPNQEHLDPQGWFVNSLWSTNSPWVRPAWKAKKASHPDTPPAHHAAVLHLFLGHKLDQARNDLQQGPTAKQRGVSSAQHNTAQHSAAQRNTAPHSAAAETSAAGHNT
jgi:hypothetical protein